KVVVDIELVVVVVDNKAYNEVVVADTSWLDAYVSDSLVWFGFVLFGTRLLFVVVCGGGGGGGGGRSGFWEGGDKREREGCILVDMMDKWFWALECSGEFIITSPHDERDASTITTKQPIDKAYSIASIKACIPTPLDLDKLKYKSLSALFQWCCRTYEVHNHLEAPPTTESSTIDPFHETNDSLVVMWMYSTISPKLVEMVVDVDTSAHGVWKRFKDLFHNNKDARVTQLDNEIWNMPIGCSSVTIFFQDIKSKADHLANLDSPVKDTSLVTYAINGIRSKEKAPTFDELRSMMLLEESDMSHQSASPSLLHNTSSSPTVLVPSTTTHDKANTMATSSALYNAIMEACGKDRPPMLAPGIDNDIYSVFNACPNSIEMWKAIKRLKQEYEMVADDDEMLMEKEIDKLVALIFMSFNKVYKPTNNNIITSSNTRNANVDNTPRTNRGTGQHPEQPEPINDTGRNRRRSKQRIEEFYLDELSPPIVTMDDQRTMAQLLQAPTEGYEDAIVHFDESFSEAWDRFKDLIRAYPYHGFLKLHQLDIFYNALSSKDQDSLNSAASGNFLDKMPRECLAIIERNSKVRYSRNKPVVAKVSTNTSTSGISFDVAELKDMVKALLLDKKNQNQAPATVKAVEESCVTCGGAHSYRNCPATNGNVYRDNIQEFIFKPPQLTTVKLQDQKLCDKANDQREKFFQIFKDLNFSISFVDALILMPKFSPSIKSLLTSKDKLCELARTLLNEHCLAVLLKKLPEKLGDPGKFLIPCVFTEKAECLALANLDASINLMPLSVWNKLSFPDLSPMCMTLELANRLISRPIRVAEDVYEVLGFSDVIASGNPTPYYDLIVSTTSPTLTSFGNSDFLLEEVDAFLAIEDDPTSLEVDQFYLDSEGDILLLEAFLNDDPSLPPPNQGNYRPEVRKELKIYEAKSDKSSIDEPPETALITALKSHKRAIAWKLSDIKGIDPEFCTHKILVEKDFKLVVQHQRRVNPKIHDVIKQEGGFTVVENEDNELILTRLVTGWRVYIDYHQEKTTFTYPYRTFTYRRMPFGLCNAPGTFQRCMVAIFHDMIEKTMEEKSHFMVKEGIVLGHKVSKQEIEVDKAKVDVITKLPHPTTVKGIRRFLGYAAFYRRFIKDFSKIARPMTCLLKKDTPFIFSKECVEAFQTLKRKLAEAPILIAPDWDMSFELMCNASDFAIGAVLGQRQDKHFKPIHYATYKTPIGCTPYKLVYGKACHLPIELERKAYWALKHANFDLQTAGDYKKVQLNELHDQAYENSLIYKEKTKRLHDSKIKDRVFNIGDRVLLFNSRLKIFSGKLKSRWSGPFTISHVYPYGTVELAQPDGPNFKVNGHHLKHYFGEDVPKMVVLDLQTFPKDH
nr:reverse transcriptase domain-containing protein [Tanacetum cinerariifolium]